MYELLDGKTPFHTRSGGPKETLAVLYYKALFGMIVWPSPDIIHNAAQRLITDLQWRDPEMRLGSRGPFEVYKHRWFAKIDWWAMWAKKVPPPPLMLNVNDPKR